VNRFRAASFATGLLVLAVAAPSWANGRFPYANQLVFAPRTPGLVVLRTTYGILPSRDDGATWGYVCEGALGLSPNSDEDPSIALTAADALVAGHFLGLSVSPDIGCNWSCLGGALDEVPVVDLATRPDAPQSVVALTSRYEESDSAAYNIDVRVFETTDGGITWAQLGGALPNDLNVATIDVTATDPSRLYVSATRRTGSALTAWLYVSTDRGSTWRGTSMGSAFDPTLENGVYIGGVDPTSAGRLYLRSTAAPSGGQSRLTVVDVGPDGTPAFRGAHAFDVEADPTMGGMLGFALSQDGATVYIGSQRDGLWSASSSTLDFQKRSSTPVGCLATRGNELWACSTESAGFIAGVSYDSGATFVPKLPSIAHLAGPAACAPTPQSACGATENGSQCAAAWESFCMSMPCGGDAGRGTPPVTTPASPPPEPSGNRPSCAAGGAWATAVATGARAAVVVCAAILAAALRRRRRRS
jgi:hypothetical protein